jgi:probable phosphomutase (TIGR03848 family)
MSKTTTGGSVTTLLLIRHGLNDWVGGRLAGWTPGVHLNDPGKAQAEALVARLADVPLAAIYSSPLERAVETAQPLAAARGLPIRVVENVGEVRYGEWTGGELKELSKHELWPGVQFYPSGTRFPGGETLGEVQMRAIAALDSLRAQHPKETVAVVAHADLIKLVAAYYLGMHTDLFQRLVINPASVTAFTFTPMGPRLLVYNDTGSLDILKPRAEPADSPVAEAPDAPAEPPADATEASPAQPAETAGDGQAEGNGVEPEPIVTSGL